jgi:hypothetical protein
MKHLQVTTILIPFFAIAILDCAHAADSLTHTYPSAVLVELKTGQSRINALRADKKYSELSEAENDIDDANAAMIRDFHDHFNYCPVYYFVDTNEYLILKKQFAGVLLDADKMPAQNIAINGASKDYVIVNYGYPAEQPHHQKVVTDSAKYESNSGEPMGKGLIINNDKMQQINYLYNLGYENLLINKKDKGYAYSSKHFNIDYYPSAKEF